MTIVAEPPVEIDHGVPVQRGAKSLAAIEKFERELDSYLAGELDEDTFRICRLNNGIYGQRQGGHNQMVRVKVPHGSLTAEQLDLLGDIAQNYSRGWGHLTTRQNVQFHFVELKTVPALMQELAAAGMTTREACGDTVRNITGCHLAGTCPLEVLDITPWAEAAFRHLLHHPYSQRLPRKFKINFSGCGVDCGQALFNDVGVIATERVGEDGSTERGFRVHYAGGLGANPRAATLLEEFTSREDLLPTIEAVLRVFDHYGNRDNKLRARMKWVVQTMGEDELRERIKKERKLLRASSSWPGGLPEAVLEAGDAPRGGRPQFGATPVSIRARRNATGAGAGANGGGPASGADGSGMNGSGTNGSGAPAFERWAATNVVPGTPDEALAILAHSPLGDVTTAQWRVLAEIQRTLGTDVRVTNRQDFAIHGVPRDRLEWVYDRLAEAGMGAPSDDLSRDVVCCPGADTCNLAVTRSRGVARAVADALEAAGLGDVPGVRINTSGCTNSCGQHHIADIGLLGVERRAHGRPAPGYQLQLGGYVTGGEAHFGAKALRLPAYAVPDAVVSLVRRFSEERTGDGDSFTSWIERAGGVTKLSESLKAFDEFAPPDEAPEQYIDFDETAAYAPEVGMGECAGA